MVEAAVSAADLVRLSTPPAGRPVRDCAGALTDETLADHPARDGEILAVEDFTAVFLSPAARRDLPLPP